MDPPAVNTEVTAGGIRPGAAELQRAAIVRVATLDDLSQADMLSDLDRGEAEVIALVRERQAGLYQLSPSSSEARRGRCCARAPRVSQVGSCICVGAPRMTPSMRIALEDMGLKRVAVVYPGTKRHLMADRGEAVPMATLAEPGRLFANDGS